MSLSFRIFSTILVCFVIQKGSTGHHCHDHYFGNKCNLNCNCIDNKCDVNGRCIDVSCKAGWSGSTCQKRNIALHSKSIKQKPIATLDASYAIDGNRSTHSETFGNRPYLYVDYGKPTKFDTLDIKYIETGNRLELCLTNDIGDIGNRRTFLRNKIRCYDMYTDTYSIRSPPVSRYVVLHPDRNQHTVLLVSEIRAQRNNLKFAIVKIKPLSTNGAHPARLAIDGSTSSYAESPGPDSKLMVNVGRICQFTQIETKLTILRKTTYDMYISNSSNMFDGIDDGLYKKFTKSGSWMSSTKWKLNMDTPIIGQYITFIKRGRGDLRIYDIRALELIVPIAAKQSISQHPYEASLAVDGNNNTFSQTFGLNPYISVDLGNTTALSSIEMDIELKDKQYELCVSNRSDPVKNNFASNDSCWNTTLLHSTWDIQTPGRGRYVTLKSQGETFLTLKEIKVFACGTGTYGNDCTLQCNRCLKYRCDGINGRCIEGCAAGWMGKNCSVICPKNCICNGTREKCDSCIEGWFGEMCSKKCSSLCSGECDQLSGLCAKCKLGLYGISCNETCSDKCKNGSECSRKSGYCFTCDLGYYGNDCNKPCPNACNQSFCDIKTGFCAQCNSGYYGNNCSLKCPSNCNNLGCKRDSGDCSACKLGFAGNKCRVQCNKTDEKCKSCALNADCDFVCPIGCKDNTCNKTTGTCESCKQSYHGDLCDLICEEHCGNNGCFRNGTCIGCAKGFYGESCLKQCPEYCKSGSCDKVTGHCLSCVDGFYGNLCIEKCPENCKDDRCEKDILHCISCKQGFYGNTCNTSCPKHCDFKGCDINSGYCFGCQSGFFGQACGKKCPKNCNLNGCNLFSGNCYGCKSSYYGSQCETACPLSCDFKGCSQNAGICFDCRDRYFGENCEHDCPDRCGNDRCERLSGTCSRCKGNFYGNRCDRKCPMHCNNKGCETNSGYCIGCQDGFFGKYCNKPCPVHCNAEGCSFNQGECIACKDGYYGAICNLTCPANCMTGQCLQFSGRCFECLNGYYGMQCEKPCPNNCDKSGCDVDRGECFRCVNGYYGNKCQLDCQKPCNNSKCQFSKTLCDARSTPDLFENSRQASQSDSSSKTATIDYNRILIPTLCTIIVCTLVIAGIVITGIIYVKRKPPGIVFKRFFDDKINNPDLNRSSFDIRNSQSEERV